MPPTTLSTALADLSRPAITSWTFLNTAINYGEAGIVPTSLFYYFIIAFIITVLINDITTFPINALALILTYLFDLILYLLGRVRVIVKKVLVYLSRTLLGANSPGHLIKLIEGTKRAVHVKSDGEIWDWIKDVEACQADQVAKDKESRDEMVRWGWNEEMERCLETIYTAHDYSTDNTWTQIPPSTPPMSLKSIVSLLHLETIEDDVDLDDDFFPVQSALSTPDLSMSPNTSPENSMILFTPGSATPLRESPTTRKGGFTMNRQGYLYHPVLEIRNALALDGMEKGDDGRMLHGVI